MRRGVAATVLLLLSLLPAVAQQRYYVRECDTLRYTYTPLQDTLPAADTVAPTRRPFLRRVVDFFSESTVDKTFEKKIDFTFIAGPSFSKNTSLGIGGLAAGLYRLDRTDSVTAPSNVSIFLQASITGFYLIGVGGNNIFRQNRSRIGYELSFSSQPTDYWGIGYAAGANNPRSTFVRKHLQINANFMRQVVKNTFLGVAAGFESTRGIRFTETDYLYGQRTRYNATSVGLVAEYDSRDFIPNPAKGLYVSLRESWFPRALGDCGSDLWRTEVTVDGYRKLWNGGILAVDFHAEFNSGGTPWPMLARLGGNYRMRGYYEGRYTDRDMITVQAELRQKIWRRIGCVVWGGAGNVFPTLADFRWSQTLPNYGAGLRWEFKNRVNVRFDFGFGRKTSGFLFNVNEAF